MSHSDMLRFDQPKLKNDTEMLNEIKDELGKILTNYLDYVDTSLRPAWQTAGGQESVDRLKNFGWNDIKSFIDYIDKEVNNLQISNDDYLNKIQNA